MLTPRCASVAGANPFADIAHPTNDKSLRYFMTGFLLRISIDIVYRLWWMYGFDVHRKDSVFVTSRLAMVTHTVSCRMRMGGGVGRKAQMKR